MAMRLFSFCGLQKWFGTCCSSGTQGGGDKNGDVPMRTVVNNQVAPIQIEQPKGLVFEGNMSPEKMKTSRIEGLTETEIFHWKPSEYEKELVKRTWSDDFDFLYSLGSAIYTYIFEHNPQTKVLFPKIHQHGDDWKDSDDFRSQALKFVQTITYAVKNIYHMEESLEPRLYEIGQLHVKYASRGFKTEYWNIFLDAIESALIEHIRSIPNFSEEQRSDATHVWRRLAYYIIVHMKNGYSDEEKKLKGK